MNKAYTSGPTSGILDDLNVELKKTMTLKEIYQALIDGKKLRYATWEPGAYIHLVGTFVLDHKGAIREESFKIYYNWSIYEEPEDLDKKIKHVEHTLEDYLDQGMALSATSHISNLIDLKIKQAKL